MLEVYANGLSVNSNSEEIRRVKYYITFFFCRTNSTFMMMMMMMMIDFSTNTVYTVVNHDKQQIPGRFFHVPY